jgi:hypothetical protein
MNIRNILFGGVALLSLISCSKSDFLVGTSTESIEPDQSLISLPMAGYGLPREGRFSLQWIGLTTAPESSAFGGSNDRLYIYGNEGLQYSNPEESQLSWKQVDAADHIIAVAGSANMLYAIDNKANLLASKETEPVKWEKMASVDPSANLIAVSGNKIYTAAKNGSVWSSEIDKSNIAWKKFESVPGIISLAANSLRLYALKADGELLQIEPARKDSKWLRIAWKNGETITQDIRHIAIANGRIYGISSENKLYRGEHRSDGNMSARAMAIKKADKQVIIVNVDIVGLTEDFTGLIKKELLLKDNLQTSEIFINSTHTHFGPISQKLLTWQDFNQQPDSLYLYGTLKNGIIRAVENASKQMAPAKLYFGRGSVDIGYNRSLKDHPELYDNSVDVLKAVNESDKKESYLFIASCHPVFSTAGKLNYTLSANYPGVARKLVEEQTGTSNSLFLQGTTGDIDPKDNDELITGRKLADAVIGILKRPMTRIEGAVSYYLDTINIPVKPWPKDEISKYRAENLPKIGDVYAEKNVRWCDLMYKYYDEGTMPAIMPEYVHTVNIGNWKLIGFSRETTTGYGFGAKKLWPEQLVSVTGYTNDVSSYLPTHMHIEEGVYEGKDSYFWDGMPNAFPHNVDSLILGFVKNKRH